jgi:hypothetical protein
VNLMVSTLLEILGPYPGCLEGSCYVEHWKYNLVRGNIESVLPKVIVGWTYETDITNKKRKMFLNWSSWHSH